MISLYDVTGKLVMERLSERESSMIDVSGLSKGMYHVIAEKEGKFARGKVVVE